MPVSGALQPLSKGTSGDKLMVLSYCIVDGEDAKRSEPRLVFVNESNNPR